jgi:hypothetical protein
MFAIFQIKDSPAIPFEMVIKVDPIFNDEKEGGKWGFSVHLGPENKRCNFYLPDRDSAVTTRDEFVRLWEDFYARKYVI